MYPWPNVPLLEIPIKALYSGYLWVSYPQESLENTINTMSTLLGLHPSLSLDKQKPFKFDTTIASWSR